MFATATRNFVEEVDHGGLLIPVSSLNDGIALLTVVVKRKTFWPWQRPKYFPTDFHFNDILTGDTPITPGIIETDFIKFNGTYGDNIQGTVDANFVHSNVSVGGKDSSKLQSSFGSLKKEEVDVQKLLRDSKGRMLDMSHGLVQQTKEKRKQSFGIVKERIVTTQPCSVIEDVQQGGQCGAGLSVCGPKNPKVSLKENGSLSKDSNVTMEIPVHTAIAYALTELEIKHDGHFELCLLADTRGGFEVDGPARRGLMGVCGAPVHVSDNNRIAQELERLSDHFQLLSALPADTRASLLQHMAKVLEDRGAVGSLESALDQMCRDETPNLGEALTAHQQNIQEIVDLVDGSDQKTAALTALHLLTSAVDEMTGEGLAVLSECCSPTVLATLETLVRCVSGSGRTPLGSSGLAALTEDTDVYEKAERLFLSSNVSLKKDGDAVKTEVKEQAGNLPLVACIAVRALASLAR